MHFQKQILFYGIVAMCVLVACNTFKSNINSDTDRSLDSTCKVSQVVKKPTGKELRVTTERIDSNRWAIKVMNISSYPVFCPYLPGESKKADFFAYMTDKWDDKEDKFIVYSKGGHYAPGIESIAPGKEIEFTFFKINRGDYRVRFSYSIDEKLASLLNNPDCFDSLDSDEDYDQIVASQQLAYSPIIRIN